MGRGIGGNFGRCRHGWSTCRSRKDMDRNGGEQRGVVEVELQTLPTPAIVLYYSKTL